MQIAKGSVTISAIDKLTTDGCIWTLSDDAEVIIPENKTMNLQFTAADQNLYGTKLVVPENAVVTVNGTLRGVSGQKGSTIEADGTIDCTNGLLSLAGKAVVNIAETGSLKVGDKGIASNSAGTTQYTGKNINLAAGGAISLTANSAWKDHANDSIQVAEGNSKPSYTDANGNTVYGSTNVENPVAVYNGGFYGSLNDALTAAGTDGGVITLMDDVTLNGSTGAIADNVTVVVPTGRKLTAGNDAATILTSAGAIQVATGGAVNLPTAEGSADWIGGADARLHLTSGTITYDLGDKMLTLDGNAEVPETKTAYLHLSDEGINAQIAKGSTLTVKGTLKAVAGSALTVDGTLNVEGTLTVAESVKNFTVNSTLNLPRMNKEEILRKSRLENHVQDERDKVISAQSTMVGMIGMTVIFLLLLVIRLFWKGGSLFDIGAMYFGYLAVAQFYQFALLRGKMRLFLAIGYTAVALLNLMGYIWKG